ncbi:MAG: DinB family protein [Anaerolineales bacterium]|nr:DinB family protein [Anaerolineales bacterium]
MSETPEHLKNRLIKEGQKSLDYFRTFSSDEWDRIIYTEGSCWTVHQVLAHFVAAEDGFHQLIEDILAGGFGTPVDFDINIYNERKVEKLIDISASSLMMRFSKVRRRTVGLVAGMDQSDLAKQGRHPFLGVSSLADIIKLIYRHNQIHIREVRKILS